MIATPTPLVDPNVHAGIRRGDEAALEQLLRSRYADLETEAKRHLGEDAAVAPRVVEHAVLDAWRARERLDTPAAFDEFLHEAVHDEALRERSRRAARHRFEAHHHVGAHQAHAPAGGPDEAWAHVAATLHKPHVSHDEHFGHVRHEAAEHLASVAKPRPWKLPALLAAVVGGLVFGGMAWADRASPELAATRALTSTEVRVLSTRMAQMGNMALGDRTAAVLRPETKLTVPPGFGETLRAVALEGAATFKVGDKPLANGPQPLDVRVGSTRLTSSEGEFGARRYPGENEVAIRVRSGSVYVVSENDSRTLTAGQALLVANDGTMRVPDAATVDERLGFMDDRFVVTDQPLRAVLPMLKRWFDLEFKVPDARLLDRRVTMRVPIGSSKGAIAALESAAGVKFGWDDTQKMMLTDARPAATP